MAKPRMKKPALIISASVWLMDEERYVRLENLDHTPRPGEQLKTDGELWRVAVWTDRTECERLGL